MPTNAATGPVLSRPTRRCRSSRRPRHSHSRWTDRRGLVNPIRGGNANDYDYCTADPINCWDLDGRWGWHSAWHWATHHKLDIALTACSFIPVVGEAAWAVRGIMTVERVALAARKYEMAERIGAWAFNSRAIGGASRLFGNSSLRTGEGLLNRKASRIAVGWSTRTLEGLGTRSTRVARWTFRVGHHDLLRGPFLLGM